MYYSLVDIFFEVKSVRKFWLPVDSTFCKGSIILSHKKSHPKLHIQSDVEVFIFLNENDTTSQLPLIYKHTVCKWTGMNMKELSYIIEKEWEELTKNMENENELLNTTMPRL